MSTSGDQRLIVKCPNCGNAGKLPLGVTVYPKVVRCTGCRMKFDPCAEEMKTTPGVVSIEDYGLESMALRHRSWTPPPIAVDLHEETSNLSEFMSHMQENKQVKGSPWPLRILFIVSMLGLTAIVGYVVDHSFKTSGSQENGGKAPAVASKGESNLSAEQQQIARELEELQEQQKKDEAWLRKIDKAYAEAESMVNRTKYLEDGSYFRKASAEMTNLEVEKIDVAIKMQQRAKSMKEKLDQLKNTTAEGAAEVAAEKDENSRLERIRRGQK
jgi:hypothetical protein